MTKRRRKSKRRGLFNKRLTPDEQAAQRDAAFGLMSASLSARGFELT